MDNTLTLMLARLDALQLRYARALDNQDMLGWQSCFASEASYICKSRENVAQSLPIALMMDDSRARIEDRTKAVDQVWAGTFEDYQTRHLVQRASHAAISAERYAMESNFIVTYTTSRGDTQVLAAGVYVDEVLFEGDEAKFLSRLAVLDADATPRYLVYPI